MVPPTRTTVDVDEEATHRQPRPTVDVGLRERVDTPTPRPPVYPGAGVVFTDALAIRTTGSQESTAAGSANPATRVAISTICIGSSSRLQLLSVLEAEAEERNVRDVGVRVTPITEAPQSTAARPAVADWHVCCTFTKPPRSPLKDSPTIITATPARTCPQPMWSLCEANADEARPPRRSLERAIDVPRYS